MIAKVAEANDLSAKGLLKFVCKFVDTGASLVITDEYSGYNALAAKMRHARINHSVQYADGLIHTNTIEGFWALVKRAWYGSHHHYSKKYIGLYIAEAAYKYNVRNQPETFAPMLRDDGGLMKPSLVWGQSSRHAAITKVFCQFDLS